MIKRVDFPVKADLHCHSSRSDGALDPADLVEYAATPRRGLRLLALTDHDNMNGVAEAVSRGQKLGITVIPGIEISSHWRFGSCDFQIHVVGLGCREDCQELAGIIREHAVIRDSQADRIAGRLCELLDFDHDLLDAMVADLRARGTFVTRKHFADFLVEQGLVRDNQDAFKRYLGKTGSAFFQVNFTPLETTVAAVKCAGGIPVLAHPFKYESMHGRTLRALAAHFAGCGGLGIEFSPQQDNQERIFIRDLAVKHGFWGSAGSDFHAPGVAARILGGDLWLPGGVQPVWELDPVRGYFQEALERGGE